MIDSIFVVDAHSHMGMSSLTGNNNSPESIIEGMDKYGIDATVLLPHAQQDLASVASVHDKIGKFIQQYPKRSVGMTSLSPRLDDDVYYNETKRCIKDLGFKGIKLEPQIHAVYIDSPIARKAFECGREFNVPVMIHTGPGSFSTPTFAMTVAEEFSDVTIILAHSGMIAFFKEALLVGKKCPNVMFESSWSSVTNMQTIINELGSNRLMLGSDHIINLPVELAKVNALDLSFNDRLNVLGNNARRVYGI